MSSCFYDLLGVSRDATTEEIKKAFKKAALLHHPDKGGDPEKFKQCTAALETLSDDRSRASYDASLLRTRSRDGLRPAGGGNADVRASSGSKSQHFERSDSQRHSSKPPTFERTDTQRPTAPPASSAPPRPPQPAPRPPPAAAAPEPPSVVIPGGKGQRIKVLSLGSGGVGKSCLIKRYCEGRFVQKYITTIGVDYGVKPVEVAKPPVKVNFFDTSGGEEFKEIRLEFYGSTNGVILVYDVTTRKTFTDLETWLEEAKHHRCPLSSQHNGGSNPCVVLLANKTDLPKRAVSKAEGQQFAKDNGMQYFETSAYSGESVQEAFDALFTQIVTQLKEARRKLHLEN